MTVESGAEQRLEIPGGLTPDLVETLCLLEHCGQGRGVAARERGGSDSERLR